MSGRLPARALLLVALVAALARGLFELQARGGEGPVAVLAGHLLGDERAFDLTARAFADGSLLRERSFYHEPLYPWLLGLAYRVAPPPPLPAGSTVVPLAAVHAGVIALQHLLGVLACVLVAALGARAVSPRVGLLAGLLAALCGPLVFVEGQLLKEGPALLLSVLALHLWLDVLEDKGPRRAALLGLLLGLGVLLRGNTYLLLAAVLGSLLLRIGGRRRPRAAALVLGCTLLALAPATVHNLHLGELVLSTYQGGSNAAIGMPDDDRPWGGFTYEPLRMGRSDTLFEEEDAVALAEAAAGRRLSGPEVSGFWWRRTLDVVVHRPAVALQRVARRVAATFHGGEPMDVKDWRFFAAAAPALSTPLSDFRLAGPLALLGLLLLPWRGRAGQAVLRGQVLAVAASLGLFFVFGRYRLSAAPALWILSVAAVDAAVRHVLAAPARRAAVTRAAGWLLLASGAVWAGQVPLGPAAPTQAVSWGNLASVEIERARLAPDAASAAARRDAAVEAARTALSLSPGDAGARTLLVRALELETPVLPARHAEAWSAALALLILAEGERTGLGGALRVIERSRDEQLDQAEKLRALPSAPGREARVAPVLAFAARRVAQSLESVPERRALAQALAAEAARLLPDDEEAAALHARLTRSPP